MEEIQIKNEFDWVIRVLESSKNKTHIENSSKLFEFFIEKWGEFFLESVYGISYRSKFNKIKNETQKKVSSYDFEV